MGNVSPTPRQLLTEGLILWSIGVVLFIGRMISRSIAAGSVKRLSCMLSFFLYAINYADCVWIVDDYVMTATFMIYTSLLILIQVSSRHGTNLFPTEETQQILSDPQQVRDRIYGSKIVIGLEQCMLFSTWGVKICMLSLFWRLTANIRFLHLYVKAIAVYVAVGFVVIMVTYFGVYCRPFEQYWQLPVENIQCATYQHYSITQAVFNISSDAAMLVVPVPLLMKTQLKARRKFILVCIMSLGVFTIFAAILNKVYNFLSPLTTMYQIWYIREASTAIYVANLICLWPLLRKLFGLKAFQSNSKHYRHHGAHLIKESPGASQSPGTTVSSQSRPSFSIPRLHLSRLGSGRTVQNVVHKGSDEMHPSPEATNKMSLTRLDTKEATHQEKKGLGEPGPTTLETHASYDLEAGDIGHIDYHSSLKFG